MVQLDMAERHKEGKNNAAKCRRPIGVKQGSPREKPTSRGGPRRYSPKKDPGSSHSNPTDLVAQLCQRLESQKTQMIFFNQRMFAEIQHGGLGQVPSKVDGADSENSDDDMYAGSRFEHAPAATVLPKPPTSWMIRESEEDALMEPPIDAGSTMSTHLKMLLKVQGWPYAVTRLSQYYVLTKWPLDSALPWAFQWYFVLWPIFTDTDVEYFFTM